ncbi:hypothetical protein OAE26_01665 [Synechococcus sp. AH-551-E05]|nr:hypothetical protein [Synechococcus sp. AH-551-E05]
MASPSCSIRSLRTIVSELLPGGLHRGHGLSGISSASRWFSARIAPVSPRHLALSALGDVGLIKGERRLINWLCYL